MIKKAPHTKHTIEINKSQRGGIEMASNKTSLIRVQGTPISIFSINQDDYICITDMAKARTDTARAADVIKKLAAQQKHTRVPGDLGNDI